ncbi:hypothetical protein QBC40DRAFT_345858 [Triangularia verruculosa]|uniref:Uncharacterized protein n=1 Tax=Triangularia verruculosa TaxID=2587418 RepID=A0AAN6XNN0_9PEZI|nr:hypothetical protein QBC40DRAFT_345858 [Triangularia verruculosa]
MAKARNNRKKGRQNAAQNGESSAQATRRAAQLELPEGYQRPSPNNGAPNGSGRSGKNRSNGPQNSQVPGNAGRTRSSSYPKPWEMTKLYGTPVDKYGTLNFNYNRPWVSLEGKDVEKELATALKKGHRESLPPVFQDYTPKQKKEVRELYKKNDMLELFEARDNCNQNPPAIRGFLGGINPAINQTTRDVNEKNPFLQFLSNLQYGQEIVNLLHPSVRDITALAFTCKQAGHIVSHVMEFWNFAREAYQISDFLPQYDNHGNMVKDPGVRREVLVITSNTPALPSLTPYRDEFSRTVRLTQKFITIPLSFRHIVLDRLPFLDVKTVDLVISSMPNLETLSISRCDLLDVTQLPALIDIIKRHPRSYRTDRHKALCTSNPTEGENKEESNDQNAKNTDGEDTETNNIATDSTSASENGDPSSSNDTSLLTDADTSQVSVATSATSVDEQDPNPSYVQLDFSPFFFRGPNTCKRLGSYGVVYNEPTFHTPKAVVALMMRCWYDAEEIGMDLVSDSASFFSFVRRLPGWDCLWTLKARDAMVTFKRELRALVLPEVFQRSVEREARTEVMAENYGSRRLSQAALQDRVAARVEKLRKNKYEELKTEIQHRLYDDLMAATSGDDFRHGENAPPAGLHLVRGETDNVFQFWHRTQTCQGCNTKLPHALYAHRIDLCWGCKMINFVRDMESSNLRRWKRIAIEHYLENLDTKKGSLTDVLHPSRNEYLQKALKAVRTADAIWLKFMNFSPSDPVVYPPEPENLHHYTDTYSRYRWKHNWPTEPFDYREGGPQHEDPFKHPNADWYDDEMCGGEPPESFNARFESSVWPEAASQALFEHYIWLKGFAWKIDDPEAQRRIAMAKRWDKLRRIPGYQPKSNSENGMWFAGRDCLRRSQNGKDASTHVMIHARVESCLLSLHTPLLRPFDLDHPFPDKRVDYEAWVKIMKRHEWEVVPAGHRRW